MSNKQSMSHNACYAPSYLCAVPRGFNLNRCRFRVCVDVYSDVTRGKVFFYQYHGMYWYVLHAMPSIRCAIQSHPYASMHNCITDFKSNMRLLHFTIETPDVLGTLVKIDANERRNVAAELNRPTPTWRV